jgi:hypothetical protein
MAEKRKRRNTLFNRNRSLFFSSQILYFLGLIPQKDLSFPK